MRSFINLLITFAVVGVHAGCSSGDTSVTVTQGDRLYRGTIAGANYTGTVRFAYHPTSGLSGNPATDPGTMEGTITTSTLTVRITGTVAAGGGVTLAGQGWTVNAGILGATFSGVVGGPSGAGTISAQDATHDEVTRYCGSFSGADRGTWNMQISDAGASGSFAGQFAAGNIQGGLAGTSLMLTFGIGSSSNRGTASGTVSGAQVSGTWRTSDGGASGSWSGSTAACASMNSANDGGCPPVPGRPGWVMCFA